METALNADVAAAKTIVERLLVLNERAHFAFRLDTLLRVFFGSEDTKLMNWQRHGPNHRGLFLQDLQVVVCRTLCLELSAILLPGNQRKGCDIYVILKKIEANLVHFNHRPLFKNKHKVLQQADLTVFAVIRKDMWKDAASDADVLKDLTREFLKFQESFAEGLDHLKAARDTYLAHSDKDPTEVGPKGQFLKAASEWSLAFASLLLNAISPSTAPAHRDSMRDYIYKTYEDIYGKIVCDLAGQVPVS